MKHPWKSIKINQQNYVALKKLEFELAGIPQPSVNKTLTFLIRFYKSNKKYADMRLRTRDQNLALMMTKLKERKQKEANED